jgi:hypothetical protein
MAPHVFKEQLKRVFHIHVSASELGALMCYFDRGGDGMINCAEFLIQFFRTGFEERSRIRQAWKQLKEERRLKARYAMLDLTYTSSVQ